MDIISIILSVILFLFLVGLYLEVKKLSKSLIQIGKWNAYLESTIKDANILVINTDKGEYEVNKKLTKLLE